jgi:hypothetical protein
MATATLTAEQEKEAEVLAQKIRVAIEREVQSLARLLASREDSDLFGKTEFEVRELVLKMGAKAYEERLREKKTATTARASNAPRADRRRTFKRIARSGR